MYGVVHPALNEVAVSCSGRSGLGHGGGRESFIRIRTGIAAIIPSGSADIGSDICVLPGVFGQKATKLLFKLPAQA
jgi:hypothetical protein